MEDYSYGPEYYNQCVVNPYAYTTGPHMSYPENYNMQQREVAQEQTNKYIFVNQNVINSQIYPNMYAVHNENNVNRPNPVKILVNPNFKPKQVHINPNFKGNSSKPSIHVNPNMLKRETPVNLKVQSIDRNNKPENSTLRVSILENVQNIIEVDNNVLKNDQVLPKPIISTRTKLVRTITKQNKTPIRKTERKVDRNKFKVTQYKIDKRSQDSVAPKHKLHFKENSGLPTKKRKLSYHSKYKIVRRSNSRTSNEPLKSLLFKSKFKICRFSSKTSLNLNSDSKKLRVSSNCFTTKVVRRNGVLSKKLVHVNYIRNKPLSLKRQTIAPSSASNRSGLIFIGGNRYKMNKNQRSLKKLDSSENSKVLKKTRKVVLWATENPDIILKANGKKIKLLFSTPNPTNIVIHNKMKKSNIPCPIYRRFGRCKGKDDGKCIRKHNPNQIALCAKFLQGACIKENCLLSHKVLPEKMPTCKFFLEGLCSKDNCPYLHVKINAKADICQAFLEGFCEKAAECDKRHQYLCPYFEKEGKCPKKNCPYPHGNRVRNVALLSVAKKFSRPPKEQFCNKTNLKFKKCENLDENGKKCLVNDTEKCSKRYYADVETLPVVQNVDENVADKVSESNDCKDLEDSVPKRPKLGQLPQFIAFSEQSS